MTQFLIKSKQDLINLANDYLKINNKNGYKCPFCNSGTKQHGTPAFSIFQGKDGKGRFTCFSCNERGDFYDLFKQLTGTTYSDGGTLHTAVKGKDTTPPPPIQSIPQTIYKPMTEKEILFCHSCLLIEQNETAAAAYKYLQGRGIDKGLIIKFQIGIDYDEKNRPYILFPLRDKQGNLKGIQKRYFTENKPFKDGVPKGQQGLNIWNEQAFSEEKPILIFEGIIDALTVYKINELKPFNAISINSTGKINAFIEYLKENKPKNRLFVFMDNDDSGEKAAAKIIKNFPLIEKAQNFIDIKPFKDLNEFYLTTIQEQ